MQHVLKIDRDGGSDEQMEVIGKMMLEYIKRVARENGDALPTQGTYKITDVAVVCYIEANDDSKTDMFLKGIEKSGE